MRLAIAVTAIRSNGEHRVCIRGLKFEDKKTAKLFAQWVVDGTRLFDVQLGDEAGEPGFALNLTQEKAQNMSGGNNGGVDATDDLLAGLAWSERMGKSKSAKATA